MKIKNQKGQGLIEYLIIVAIVAVGALSIMRVVGQSVNVKFAHIAKSLGAKVEGQIGSAEVKQNHINKKSMRNFMQGSGGAANRNEDTNDESD